MPKYKFVASESNPINLKRLEEENPEATYVVVSFNDILLFGMDEQLACGVAAKTSRKMDWFLNQLRRAVFVNKEVGPINAKDSGWAWFAVLPEMAGEFRRLIEDAKKTANEPKIWVTVEVAE